MSVTVRDIITEAATRANVNPGRSKRLPDDLFESGMKLFEGVLEEFSANDYIDAYQNEVDFNLTNDTVFVGEGTEAEVIANKIQLPKKVLYKYTGQMDWTPMEFIAYQSFYSAAYSDYVVSWQPVGPNLYKLYFKPRFVGTNPQIKLIYNVEMKYVDNDPVNLPTPYIELLTRALAVKYAIKYPRVDGSKLASLKEEQAELEKTLKANNASLKIITRGGNPSSGPYRGMLRGGEYISRSWF